MADVARNGRGEDTGPAGTVADVDVTAPDQAAPDVAAADVEAVMSGALLLVAVTARSLAAIEAEVSLPQLRVLVILASRGPQSLNAVARSLDIHPSNATRACDKLVEGGLLCRREDPGDRRVLQLTLTGLGEQLVQRVMDHRRTQIEGLLGQVPSAERETLVSAFRTFAATGGESLERAAWQSGWATGASVQRPPAPTPG